MNQSSAEEQPSNTTPPVESLTERRSLPPSLAHQLLTLIGFTFVLFEIIFVELYSDNIWFSFNISWLGIPAILLIAATSHFVLLLLQSRKATQLVYWILKGKPLVTYTRWLELDQSGFTYGIRHVQWEAVEELFLTLFGNLEVRSYALSGTRDNQPDPLFKFPFGAGSQSDQKLFAERALSARPDMVLNKRLTKRIESPIVKGQNAIQLIGAVFMSLILFDVGYSSFSYLEMLKHYNLAQVDGSLGQPEKARAELQIADDIRTHPLPISYVTSRFMTVGSSGAGVMQARANALWFIGDKEGALVDTERAIVMAPDNFRLQLMKARILTELHKDKEARAAIEIAITKHKNSLLPRLYLIANSKDASPKEVEKSYRESMKDLTESTFADEPMWPPGGNRFLHDVFYSEDVYFVFDKLLNVPLKERK